MPLALKGSELAVREPQCRQIKLIGSHENVIARLLDLLMASMSMSTLETIEAKMVQVPATILNQLGLPTPFDLSAGIDLSRYRPTVQVVAVHLDNFGLLEVALHKPQFLLKACKTMLTLETSNGYAANVTSEVIHGNLTKGFHLFTHLLEQGKTVGVVDREDQQPIGGSAYFHAADSDMRTYIETAKLLNRSDFLYIHFLDFDKLYQEYTNRPPLELAQKLLHRTDRWLLGFYKQARPHTLFLILGNQGQRDYGLKYKGKYQNWAQANIPIALVIKKGEESDF
jgi:hypothetical protein